jgi:hypothetical protein
MLKQSMSKINGMLEKISLKAVLIVAMLAVPFITLASAQQAYAAYACYEGQVCIYDLDNGGGQGYGFTLGNPTYCLPLPGYANDMANSYFNRSGRTLTFYVNTGCSGPIIKSGIGPGRYGNIPYFCETGNVSNCKNKLSSIRVQ